MEQIPDNLQGWIWWVISVILVGILINLLSTYLYPSIETKLAQRSQTRRTALEAKRNEFETMVSQIAGDNEKFLSMKIDLVTHYLRIVFYIALGLLTINAVPEVIAFSLYRFTNSELIYLSSFMLVPILTLSFILPILNRIRLVNQLIKAVEEQS